MNKKQGFALVAIVLLALMLVAATYQTTIWLKANETVTVMCQGDELIITPYGDEQVEITCRVWVER